MDSFKGIAKGGWHPKGKDGKSGESWRGDFKGIDQVAGWMGKGKSNSSTASEHISRPLSTLKDPSSFGPPPKNVNFHGGAALPNQITPHTEGLGKPLTQDQIRARQQQEEEEERRRQEEEERPKPPPAPFKVDTTGLSTANLPPPPGRKDGADGRDPATQQKAKPPGLPPRLPPRNDTSSRSPSMTAGTATSQADSHKGFLNQGAVKRLGAAGISVPEFGIGSTSTSKQLLPPPSLSPSTTSPTHVPASPSRNALKAPDVNELQSRFSRLSSSSSTTPTPTSPPASGTSFAEKQAAVRTASNFRNDPSSVSVADARSAASTAHNFQQRHGEQVKSGWQSANKLNTKYGIADKVGGFAGAGAGAANVGTTSPVADGAVNNGTDSPAGLEAQALGKKKPPPPPVKKANLATPPPLPLSTKPKPG